MKRVLLVATAALLLVLLLGASLPSNPDGIPAGRLVHIPVYEDVVLSADNWTVSLSFFGGTSYPPTDPCSVQYAGWARSVGGRLEVAVVELPVVRPPTESPAFCLLGGTFRVVTVGLNAPFLGTTAVDRSDGQILRIKRPG